MAFSGSAHRHNDGTGSLTFTIMEQSLTFAEKLDMKHTQKTI